jgi:diguanylate cyclase (GGDEF)-like protein/PAS domain S-box-containing protein
MSALLLALGAALLAAVIAALLARRASRFRTETAWLRDGIDALDEGFALFDAQDRLQLANEAYRQSFPNSAPAWQAGMGYEQMQAQAAAKGDVPAALGQETDWVRERMTCHASPGQPWLQARADGRWMRIQERRTALGALVSLRTDVSELVAKERALAASQAQLQAIIGTAGVAILTLDEHSHIRSANPATERMLGYAEAELLGQDMVMLVDHEMRRAIASFLRLYLAREDLEMRGQQREFPVLHKSGRELTVQLALAEVKITEGRMMVAVLTDITERKRYEIELQHANEQLMRLSTTDPLTELGNRRLLMQRLEDEWRRALRSKEPMSLLLLDVDHFKLYNDHYGHPAGDACLQAIAGVLRACAARPSDLAARYGGEEFVLLLPETGAEGAMAVAQRIRQDMRAAALPHANSPLSDLVTLSMGLISVKASQGGSPAQWLAQADLALYRAKAQGRDRVVQASAV